MVVKEDVGKWEVVKHRNSDLLRLNDRLLILHSDRRSRESVNWKLIGWCECTWCHQRIVEF